MPHSSRKTIFVTGGSGVVGQALLEALSNFHIIGLVHQTPIKNASVVSLSGDISSPWLGLTRAEFNELAKRIDCIIHAAAITNLSERDQGIFRTNVEGTRYVLDLAAKAQVPVYYISTAFVHSSNTAENDDKARPYERSKREAERIVQTSGLSHVIIRPSVIVGDSQTGAIASFQGIHLILSVFVKGLLPVIPASPQSAIDFVPQDLVATTVAALINREQIVGEYWLTAGRRALTLQQLAELCGNHAHRLIGRTVTPVRMVTPDLFERLIRPVFLPALPARMRRTIDRAMQLSKYLIKEEPFPTSLPDLELELDLPLALNLEEVVLHNLEYWAAANGYLRDSTNSETGRSTEEV